MTRGHDWPGRMLEAIAARRGDIVLMDSDRGPVLGVCVGAVVAKAGAEGGIEYVALSLARRAWRLP